jgi:hypothetical protein
MTEPVRKLFADTQPGPEADDIGPTFVDTARAVAAICATRVLLLIAVLTGAAIWVFTVYDPTRDRLFAAIAFSVVFVIPQTLLYFRKG